MSWISCLDKTYDECIDRREFRTGEHPLLPISHTTAEAQIEIVLDSQGTFLRATQIPKNSSTTLIPCSEESGNRAGSKPAAHPLCDKLQYIAGDFQEYGGEVTSGFAGNPAEPFEAYLTQLESWVSFSKLAKLEAILRYVKSRRAITDLMASSIIPMDRKGKFLRADSSEERKLYPIYSVLQGGQHPEDAFVRWSVETPGNADSSTSEDEALWESWIKYCQRKNSDIGLCSVSGSPQPIARLHPSKLRHAADRAKIISSNDTSGFTFRGRFLDAEQACSVGYELSQKAHCALRWLIGRQGYKNGRDQTIVCWSPKGHKIPQPLVSTLSLFEDDLPCPEAEVEFLELPPSPGGDVGQTYAIKLRKRIAGYRAKLPNSENVLVMGLDSATPGRMAITYYRELTGAEFLNRIENWHLSFAWPLRFSEPDPDRGKNKRRTIWSLCAPAPKDIGEVAYGRRLDEKLSKSTIERILPCIVDGRPFPIDLVQSSVRRAANRVGFAEHWEWEKALRIACAVYRGYYLTIADITKRRKYNMALENGKTSRDYLYGRLLAFAEHIEEKALWIARENRDTTAAKLMQRFSDRPYSTWKSIETALVPYKSRIRAKWPGYLAALSSQVDEVFGLFEPGDFQDDSRLSGEFLLGYHCQRQILRQPDGAEEQLDLQTEQN